ncbi:methyl-accepting chemotaxis protein [Hahella sp. CR1]|uniref:methyl-accepting chemotaxis protein n=1 Tax=Hahella sp. CR1 TaxID=2992807 RepID=UPI002442ACE1|nr:methyl-accepting chemotaxis protein [Hahella sp. CR1]MDG9671716.1 methyl-accepting chemotaxis protein [Hahella sp. CR1]
MAHIFSRVTRRITIFHRALMMSAVFAIILTCALVYLLGAVHDMLSTIEGQRSMVEQQNTAVAKQNQLVSQQQHLNALLAESQTAFAQYSEYLYWRLDSATTAEERSISQGDQAEKNLRDTLDEIAGTDEEMADVADVVLMYLDDFNKSIAEAVDRTRNNDSRQRVSAMIGEARTASMAMSSTFKIILEEAAKAAAAANEGVGQAAQEVSVAANQVLEANDSVAASGRSLQQEVLFILVVSVTVSLLVGFLLSRSITQPIHRLRRVITEIEDTNDLTKRVDYSRQDEIGAIAQAFNAMMDKFSVIVGDLAKTTDELSASSEQSARISAQTKESAEQLSHETDQVATASNEMTATVKGINENTDNAANIALEARKACESGKTSVDGATTRINELTQAINETSDSVSQLAKESESIGAVLDVIRGIAEQTNLLALNAAIEAARAGDQGRGFAVVADEVRTLAQRTGNSTDEIQKMIEQLRAGVNKAVTRMEQSCKRAEGTVSQASQAAESIDKTLSAVTSMHDANQYVAQATYEQREAAESIDRSIVNISELSQTLHTAAEENFQSSDNLKQMVTRLRQLVVQFRY